MAESHCVRCGYRPLLSLTLTRLAQSTINDWLASRTSNPFCLVHSGLHPYTVPNMSWTLLLDAGNSRADMHAVPTNTQDSTPHQNPRLGRISTQQAAADFLGSKKSANNCRAMRPWKKGLFIGEIFPNPPLILVVCAPRCFLEKSGSEIRPRQIGQVVCYPIIASYTVFSQRLPNSKDASWRKRKDDRCWVFILIYQWSLHSRH